MHDRSSSRYLRRIGLGSYFRPNQIEARGITHDRLRRLEAAGVVERVARGLYRLADTEPTEHYTDVDRLKYPTRHSRNQVPVMNLECGRPARFAMWRPLAADLRSALAGGTPASVRTRRSRRDTPFPGDPLWSCSPPRSEAKSR